MAQIKTICKCQLAMAVTVAALVHAIPSAFAVTRTWKGAGTGSTISTASSFEDSDHWLNGVPESGDSVYFTNCTAGVWNYIRAASVPTLSGLNARHWQNPANERDVVFVSDGGVNFTASEGGNSLVLSPHIYANVSADKKFTCWTMHLCGDFSSTCSDWQITLASLNLNYRPDRYANAEGGARTNEMAVSKFQHGSGTFSIYAPQGLHDSVSSAWNQEAGSSFLYPVSQGTIQVFSAGAPVSGDGIPVGTYLKRVFPDGSIELSNPIEVGKTIQGNTLTFGPLDVSVVQRIGTYWLSGNSGARSICLNRLGEADELALTIGELSSDGGTSKLRIDVTDADVFTPGELILENTSKFKAASTFEMGVCHVTFAAGAGFPNSVVNMPAAGQTAHVTVRENVSAQLGRYADKLLGSIVKDGAGVLSLALTNAPASNVGGITVNAGTVEFIGGEGGQPYVGSLSISDGGKIVLGEGGLRVGAFSASGSVEVGGSGVLVVPATATIDGVRFGEGTSVRFEGANAHVNWTSPATNVVGCPAVWVDVSNMSSLTLEDDVYVQRIDDVRGADHFYATVSSSVQTMQPEYKTVGSSCYVQFKSVTDDGYAKTDPRHYGALVWNRSISGIRAVFLVQDTYDGGGEILGKTTGRSDFARPSGLGWTYLVIWSGAAECVKNAACYVNGERRNFKTSNAYPYRGGSFSGNYGTVRHLPNVTEVHPAAPGASADCWGMDPSTDQKGQLRLCECIVYTNELTEAERLAVAGYLSRKWVGREISYEAVTGANLGNIDMANAPCIKIGEGESVAAESLSGSGALLKDGPGTMSLLSCADASADLVVKGGRLVVGSGQDKSAIPDGAYLHLDASKEGSVTLATDAKGREYVSEWTDVREGSGMSVQAVSATTNGPTLKTAAQLQNMPVVDFGPWSGVSYVKDSTPQLDFARNGTLETVGSSPGLRTEIVVLGSANGGGLLIGGGRSHGFNEDYGVTRAGGNSGNALVRYDNSVKQWTYNHAFYEGDNAAICRNDIRVNGVPVLGTQADVLSGAYDLVTFSVYDAFGGTCFGAHHWGYFNGGNEMGEVLLFREQLSSQTLDRVEAYLRKKWFGVESVSYPSAMVQSIDVASGAELEVRGGSPIRTASLRGAGTIAGDVALVEGATLLVDVADGAVSTLAVSGTLEGDGTIVLGGSLKTLPYGKHTVVRADAVKGTWTLVTTVDDKARNYRVAVKDGVICVSVSKIGFTIDLR